jgi:hypothetical protein
VQMNRRLPCQSRTLRIAATAKRHAARLILMMIVTRAFFMGKTSGHAGATHEGCDCAPSNDEGLPSFTGSSAHSGRASIVSSGPTSRPDGC